MKSWFGNSNYKKDQGPKHLLSDEVTDVEDVLVKTPADAAPQGSAEFSLFRERAAVAPESPVVVDEPNVVEHAVEGKKGRFTFKRGPKAVDATETPVVAEEGEATEAADLTAGPRKRRLKIPKYAGVPIQVVIGYLPEVAARDATEYAMGIAEKHFEQIGLSYFYVQEYDGGYAFEVHEGGDGKAFLPGILNYFKSQPPYDSEEHVSAVLKTATRMVEVLRLRQGLAALILPEDSDKQATGWLTAGKAMTPAINRQRAFFVAGLVVFATGVLAMGSTAMFFRLQGYLPPAAPKVEMITASQLPSAQWTRIEQLPPDSSVKALRFKNEKWVDIELEGDAPPASTAQPVEIAAAPSETNEMRTQPRKP